MTQPKKADSQSSKLSIAGCIIGSVNFLAFLKTANYTQDFPHYNWGPMLPQNRITGVSCIPTFE